MHDFSALDRQIKHFVIQKITLKEQLKDYTKRLIEFERIHRLVRRYGLQTTFLKYSNTRMVEDYLSGGYERSLSTYQCLVQRKLEIENRLQILQTEKNCHQNGSFVR